MTNFMKDKIVLFNMGGAEPEEYMVIVNHKDIDIAKDAICHARGEFFDQQGDDDHYDLLEDHVKRALQGKEIEFTMPAFREH